MSQELMQRDYPLFFGNRYSVTLLPILSLIGLRDTRTYYEDLNL